jgi:hypothetical protein
VHLPLGLAFVMPALALGFAWALWRGRVGPRAWLTVIALQALLLGAGLAASSTGEREEDRVERVVPEAAIERHEESAEQFVWAAGLTLAAAILVLAVRKPAFVRVMTAVTVGGTVLVAAAAIRVGHAGGQLVYLHNAGAAYAATGPQTQRDVAPGSAADRRHAEDD